MRAAPRPKLRLSLGLQSHAGLHVDRGRGLVEIGRIAEDTGFDGVVIGDHVVLGDRLDRYPYPPVHFTQDASFLEPLTVLSAIAAVTSTITLATGVLVSPLRPAVLLAKTAASVDAISGGRLELGVGVGWQPEEFAANGVEFAHRGRLLTEGIAVCQTLWRDSPASFHGRDVTFDRLWCHPQPADADGIPVLFSGSLHERNVARIVELGVGWITHPRAPLDDIRAGVDLLRSRFAAAGRDPDELRIRTRLPIAITDDGEVDTAQTLSSATDCARAGVTDLTVWTNTLTRSPEQIGSRIRQLGEAWRGSRARSV